MSRNFLRAGLTIALLAAGTLLAPPAQAAPKVFKSTIAFPSAVVGFSFASGTVWGEEVPQAEAQLRQACPTKGSYDGHTWRFFDLGDGASFKKFVASGPKPVFEQDTPVGRQHDYDIDLFLFDAKCNRLAIVGSGGGIEKTNLKKAARYAAIVYFSGPYLNLPVTLEAS